MRSAWDVFEGEELLTTHEETPVLSGWEINKDQYTDINRDVSRMLYEKVGDAEGLADQNGREKWQEVASAEVERAVQTIRTQEQSLETFSQDV